MRWNDTGQLLQSTGAVKEKALAPAGVRVAKGTGEAASARGGREERTDL